MRAANSVSMHEEADNGLDGWLIGELRSQTRPLRVDELLLAAGEPEAVLRLVGRIDAVERELAELRGRLGRRLGRASVHHAAAHTRFLPAGEGYEIVEADGPPPRSGEELSMADARYRVLRVGPSPFPFDRRPCVFLVTA